MTPKAGEVYIVDLGFDGKVRPVVVVSREDSEAPRALSVVVPLTSQFRGSRYEVKMPRVPCCGNWVLAPRCTPWITRITRIK